MLRSIKHNKLAPEGYIYCSYGDLKYLKHAIASVQSLRRHDDERPVALICEEQHRAELERLNLISLFDVVYHLKPEHASIVGFKHNIHEYLLFEKNLFLDSDMVWCKDPETLWQKFSAYPFTITGSQVSDNFFGGPKNLGIITDIFLRRRQRTLRRFGLSYLSRVQTGMIFAQDYNLTKKVCHLAQEMLERKDETHFRSRTLEQGRSEESCEWSLAMAMSKLNLPVYPWLQGHSSPQLDYVGEFTSHDPDFEYVVCTYYSDEFVYSLRGLKHSRLRSLLINLISLVPGKGDYMKTTPYVLHFGWYHEKQPFYAFAEKTWNRLKAEADSITTEEKKDRLAVPNYI